PDDHRSIVDFSLDRRALQFLERVRTKSAIFLVVGAHRVVGWPRISVEIHERARDCLDFTGAGPGAPVAGRVQAPRHLSVARYFPALHHSADRLEQTAHLDHAPTFAVARKSGKGRRT